MASRNLLVWKEISFVDNVLLVHESEIDKMSEFDLIEVLSQFKAEVKKDRGEMYPEETLLELISSLQKYLEVNGHGVNIFSNLGFKKLRKLLDVEMKWSVQNNASLKPNQAELIPFEIECSFWKEGFSGTKDPECLLRALFYLIGLNFGMPAGSVHRLLNIINFFFENDDTGKEYLLYNEGVSKTYQRGLCCVVYSAFLLFPRVILNINHSVKSLPLHLPFLQILPKLLTNIKIYFE